MESSSFYLDKAEQCRRLAATIVMRDDPAVAALLALSAEFAALAVVGDARDRGHDYSQPGEQAQRGA